MEEVAARKQIVQQHRDGLCDFTSEDEAVHRQGLSVAEVGEWGAINSQGMIERFRILRTALIREHAQTRATLLDSLYCSLAELVAFRVVSGDWHVATLCDIERDCLMTVEKFELVLRGDIERESRVAYARWEVDFPRQTKEIAFSQLQSVEERARRELSAERLEGLRNLLQSRAAVFFKDVLYKEEEQARNKMWKTFSRQQFPLKLDNLQRCECAARWQLKALQYEGRREDLMVRHESVCRLALELYEVAQFMAVASAQESHQRQFITAENDAVLRSITSSFASNSRSVACNALCDAEAQEREHVVENWARIYLGLLEHNVETMQRQSAEQCWLSTLHEAFESHIQEEFAIRRGAVEKEEQQARCDTLLVPYHSGMCSICEQCWNESVVSDVISPELSIRSHVIFSQPPSDDFVLARWQSALAVLFEHPRAPLSSDSTPKAPSPYPFPDGKAFGDAVQMLAAPAAQCSLSDVERRIVAAATEHATLCRRTRVYLARDSISTWSCVEDLDSLRYHGSFALSFEMRERLSIMDDEDLTFTQALWQCFHQQRRTIEANTLFADEARDRKEMELRFQEGMLSMVERREYVERKYFEIVEVEQQFFEGTFVTQFYADLEQLKLRQVLHEHNEERSVLLVEEHSQRIELFARQGVDWYGALRQDHVREVSAVICVNTEPKLRKAIIQWEVERRTRVLLEFETQQRGLARKDRVGLESFGRTQIEQHELGERAAFYSQTFFHDLREAILHDERAAWEQMSRKARAELLRMLAVDVVKVEATTRNDIAGIRCRELRDMYCDHEASRRELGFCRPVFSHFYPKALRNDLEAPLRQLILAEEASKFHHFASQFAQERFELGRESVLAADKRWRRENDREYSRLVREFLQKLETELREEFISREEENEWHGSIASIGAANGASIMLQLVLPVQSLEGASEIWRDNCTQRMELCVQLEQRLRVQQVVDSGRFSYLSETRTVVAGTRCANTDELTALLFDAPPGKYFQRLLEFMEEHYRSQVIEVQECAARERLHRWELDDNLNFARRFDLVFAEKDQREQIARLGLFGAQVALSRELSARQRYNLLDPIFSRDQDKNAATQWLQLCAYQEAAHRASIHIAERAIRTTQLDVVNQQLQLSAIHGTERACRNAVIAEYAETSLAKFVVPAEAEARNLLVDHWCQSFVALYVNYLVLGSMDLVRRAEHRAFCALSQSHILGTNEIKVHDLEHAEAEERFGLWCQRCSMATSWIETCEKHERDNTLADLEARVRYERVTKPFLAAHFRLLQKSLLLNERGKREAIRKERRVQVLRSFCEYEASFERLFHDLEASGRRGLVTAFAIEQMKKIRKEEDTSFQFLRDEYLSQTATRSRDELLFNEKRGRRGVLELEIIGQLSKILPEKEAMERLTISQGELQDYDAEVLAVATEVRQVQDQWEILQLERKVRSELKKDQLCQVLPLVEDAAFGWCDSLASEQFRTFTEDLLLPRELCGREDICKLEEASWKDVATSQLGALSTLRVKNALHAETATRAELTTLYLHEEMLFLERFSDSLRNLALQEESAHRRQIKQRAFIHYKTLEGREVQWAERKERMSFIEERASWGLHSVIETQETMERECFVDGLLQVARAGFESHLHFPSRTDLMVSEAREWRIMCNDFLQATYLTRFSELLAAEREDRRVVWHRYYWIWLHELECREASVRSTQLQHLEEKAFSKDVVASAIRERSEFCIHQLEDELEPTERSSIVGEHCLEMSSVLVDAEQKTREALAVEHLFVWYSRGLSSTFERALRGELERDEDRERAALHAHEDYLVNVLHPLESLVYAETCDRLDLRKAFFQHRREEFETFLEANLRSELQQEAVMSFEYDLYRPGRRNLFEMMKVDIFNREANERGQIFHDCWSERASVIPLAEEVHRDALTDSLNALLRHTVETAESTLRSDMLRFEDYVADGIFSVYYARSRQILVDFLEVLEHQRRRGLLLQYQFSRLNLVEEAELFQRRMIVAQYYAVFRNSCETTEEGTRKEIVAARDREIYRQRRSVENFMRRRVEDDELYDREEMTALALVQLERHYRRCVERSREIWTVESLQTYEKLGRSAVAKPYWEGWQLRMEWAEKRSRKLLRQSWHRKLVLDFSSHCLAVHTQQWNESVFNELVMQQRPQWMAVREWVDRAVLEQSEVSEVGVFRIQMCYVEKEVLMVVALKSLEKKFAATMRLVNEMYKEKVLQAAEALTVLKNRYAEGRVSLNFELVRLATEKNKHLMGGRSSNPFLTPAKMKTLRKRVVENSPSRAPSSLTKMEAEDPRTANIEIVVDAPSKAKHTLHVLSPVLVFSGMTRRALQRRKELRQGAAAMAPVVPPSQNGEAMSLPPLRDVSGRTAEHDSPAPHSMASAAMALLQGRSMALNHQDAKKLLFEMRCRRQQLSLERSEELKLIGALMKEDENRVCGRLSVGSTSKKYSSLSEALGVSDNLAQQSAETTSSNATLAETQNEHDHESSAHESDEEFFDPTSTQGHKLLKVIQAQKSDPSSKKRPSIAKKSTRSGAEAALGHSVSSLNLKSSLRTTSSFTLAPLVNQQPQQPSSTKATSDPNSCVVEEEIIEEEEHEFVDDAPLKGANPPTPLEQREWSDRRALEGKLLGELAGLCCEEGCRISMASTWESAKQKLLRNWAVHRQRVSQKSTQQRPTKTVGNLHTVSEN